MKDFYEAFQKRYPYKGGYLMKKMNAFVIAAMVLGLGFPISNIRGIEASEYDKGKDIYENQCQMCQWSKRRWLMVRLPQPLILNHYGAI
jgi:hypothetical protein